MAITDRNDEVEMHPDDRRSREEAKAEAREFGREVALTRLDDLVALLTTYADSRAHSNLEDMRAWFWGEALLDRAAAAKKTKKRKAATS